MPTMADANKRIPLAKALMRALGVLPAQ
jgi:hypothetical protein